MRVTTVDLGFDLDPNRKTFRGTASYELDIDRGRHKLEFHAIGLRISGVRLQIEGATLRGRVEERPDTQTIALHFDHLVPSGSAQLELTFRGSVRRDLRGLYGAGSGDEAWLASQLCPIDARRLFPCLDEPGFKARYRICVTAPAHLMAVSNAPVESERIEADGRRSVQFETTPPLSSYLVAVAVGPFDASPISLCGHTAMRVLTLPGRQSLGTFARRAAAESLARLERWFGAPHPYPKLDLLALPAFAFGAMENAGAVFFRDSILLLDEENASLADRKRTAEVVAHELSHMWFGNSVTMSWWNDLWLNEAFATFMAYEIVDDWQPEWHIWHDFAQRREEALVTDALTTSHPIAPPVRRAEEAQENFDAITYTKGASVLRMLERYLGREVFREGIRTYIDRHAGANAEARHLWDALAEASGEDVEAIVSPWTLQTGYPLVSLERKEQRFALRQERFVALDDRSKSKRVTERRASATRWPIPWIGRLAHAGRTETLKRVVTKRRTVWTESAREIDWIYPNDAESGFFRVDHGETGHRAILTNVMQLSAIERIGFVGNQWALCRSGRLEIGALLDLIAALADDTDPDVLYAIEAVLSRIARRLESTTSQTATSSLFQNWICNTFSPACHATGLGPQSDEGDRERLRRVRLLSITGGLGRADFVLRECTRRCAQHFAEGTPLSAELAGVQLRLAAHSAGPLFHAALRDATRKAKTPQARRQYLFALAGFAEGEVVETSLDAALDSELAPAPDRAQLIAELLANPSHAIRTWRRLQKSWGRLEKEMPPILLARLAGVTAEALPVSESASILSFFAAHPLAAGSRALSQISEELRIAARFEDEARPVLEAYLRRSGG